MLLGGRRSGQNADDSAVSEAFGDHNPGLGVARMFLVNLVFGLSEIAGIGVERVEESVKSAVGDVPDAGLRHVVILDLLEDFGVDAHLFVSAVLFAAGVDAQNAELAKNNAKTKCGKDDQREDEDKTLCKLRH